MRCKYNQIIVFVRSIRKSLELGNFRETKEASIWFSIQPQNEEGEETLKAILPQKLSEKSAITQRLRRQAKVIISLITLFVLCPLISFHKPHFFLFFSSPYNKSFLKCLIKKLWWKLNDTSVVWTKKSLVAGFGSTLNRESTMAKTLNKRCIFSFELRLGLWLHPQRTPHKWVELANFEH